jgi:uncharacterized protein YprB with RNaseH-like and TPR domain
MKQLIATFDIETSGLKPDFGRMLCAVIKPWQGKCKVMREDDYGRVHAENTPFAKDVIEELNRYPVLIAHNGRYFDRKFLNTLSIMGGSDVVVNPFGKLVDPVLIARQHLLFSSNRLDALADRLDTKYRKTRLDGRMWQRAGLGNDKKALDVIVDHCVKDVKVLEEVAWRLRHFVKSINEWGSA